MRTRTLATLAAVGLATVAVVGAGSASAADAPHLSRGTRVASPLLTHGLTTAASSLQGQSSASVLRWSGSDRYATAAEISRQTGWDNGNTLVVFLASGTSLPDALALGPATTGAGPVLLTERDRLPDATRAELQRLHPCLLVVAGGAPSVSQAVVDDASQYADVNGPGCQGE
ncbi:cell wall-binding repeat-containing protein [Kineococcus sp. NPDC059986]|uniref:cell wall-binding repeat-containing protein n=1 Tax=Kineococcus sp. NPDC059986 TaxID=3155538 RepID=UPI00344BDD93